MKIGIVEEELVQARRGSSDSMLKSSPPKEMPRLKPSRISVMRWSKNPMVEFSSESTGDDSERLKSGFIPKGSTDLGGELLANGSAPKMSLTLDGASVRGWIGGGDTVNNHFNIQSIVTD